MRGRGRSSAHKSATVEEKSERVEGVARVGLDYFFMTREDADKGTNPMIVMVDEQSGEKYSRATGIKGLGVWTEMEWLIRDLSRELKAWGHHGGQAGHLIVKSDAEPAIRAVVEALAKYHGGRVIVEHPPKGESQSNGLVEEAGKTIREYVRVLRDHIEFHADIDLRPEDVIVQ